MRKTKKDFGPTVSEIKMRGDLDRSRRELQKMKKAALEGGPATEPVEGELIADEGLATAIVGLREEIIELTETRHRLSKLYFQHLENTQRRTTKLKSALRMLGRSRGENGSGPLLAHLADCIRDHVPFQMVTARIRVGERLVAAAFSGVPEEARGQIAARTPTVREMESWMSAPCQVGEAFFIPYHVALNSEIPGWLPTLDPRESEEWHAEDVLLVPVRDAADALLAVFSLDDPSDRAVPSSESLEVLELIARYAAIALENARLYEAVRAREKAAAQRQSRRARLRELRGALVASVMRGASSAGRAGSGPDAADEAGEGGMERLIGRMSDEEGRRGRLAARLESLDRVEDALLATVSEPGDLGLALQEAALLLQPLANGRQIALKLQNAATDTEVEAGSELLRELVLELGRNALMFTPAGGTVSLRLSGDASDVMLEVADTGCGIEPDRLAHVFDGYRGVTAAAQGEGEAGGIGLAICKSIVEWHGGRIFLESGEGRGTRVSVILPKRSPDRDHESRSHRRTAGTQVPPTAQEEKPRATRATEAANDRGR